MVLPTGAVFTLALISETLKLYGIEAARKTIIRELRNVADGLRKVHFHHISVLVDYMCFDGSLISSIVKEVLAS